MLYVIKLGTQSVLYNLKQTSMEDVIYCITSVEQIKLHKLEFVFSNGHAVNALTDFFDETDVEDMLNIIDENAINTRYWRDDNDLDLKRRKEAEFLVLGAILGFAVNNETVGQKLLKLGVDNNKITVKQGYYF
jgi:hypothetical protein